MKYLLTDIHSHHCQEGELCLYNYSPGIDPPPAPGALFSAGLHPWIAEEYGTADLEWLRSTPAAAIGEAGLDFARTKSPRQIQAQTELFAAQIEIASRRGLPLIVHCVKAYNEVLAMLSGVELKAVIFHGYTGSAELTARIIGRGYFISVGPATLGSSRTSSWIKQLPLRQLFAETDDSGRDIREIYDQTAALYGLPVRQIAEAINDNFTRIFKEDGR